MARTPSSGKASLVCLFHLPANEADKLEARKVRQASYQVLVCRIRHMIALVARCPLNVELFLGKDAEYFIDVVLGFLTPWKRGLIAFCDTVESTVVEVHLQMAVFLFGKYNSWATGKL
ncbi:hypothetical protein SYNPS1DRAFT_27605 [Syncephalis pseudoplumigaleata]|uniref:Uncharacterized protein n=1 Tax=Syncephalis pseudoplumigaleata TaxID=1712513 RepID=A0A4P9Z2V6_9FUNG|nr:hypothetical protein SYNPS1DRAFT_27605 [Syncephalis pseudoplumigaleata]|eukprot:RKP26715.1 hypothetical protein SYNPS1DRAFT_27605 [Syncephalis pseudoplumigaleata]